MRKANTIKCSEYIHARSLLFCIRCFWTDHNRKYKYMYKKQTRWPQGKKCDIWAIYRTKRTELNKRLTVRSWTLGVSC